MRFRDKVVWITGASSGIGEALAYAFYKEGANLILSARRTSELERVMSECKNGAADEFPKWAYSRGQNTNWVG